MTRKQFRSEHEQEFNASREAHFVCGLCEFSYIGPMCVWLPLRELHRADAHPAFREKKRRSHSIRGLNRKIRYEEEMAA